MKYQPPRYLFRRYEILKRLPSRGRFLEIGPGALHLTRELGHFFQSGTLIEYNPLVEQLFTDLPDELQSRLDLVVGDFLSTDLEGSFDCVIACEVMEHVENDQLFLSKISELTEPGGRLILSVPARMDLWAVDDELVGHFRRYERIDLYSLLAKHGFESINIVSYGFPFTRLARVPRKLLAALKIRRMSNWSQKKRSQASGVPGITSRLAASLGLFLNPATVYPFGVIATLFSQYDYSDGYLAFAVKRDTV